MHENIHKINHMRLAVYFIPDIQLSNETTVKATRNALILALTNVHILLLTRQYEQYLHYTHTHTLCPGLPR